MPFSPMSFAPESTLDELYISSTDFNGRIGLGELFTMHNPPPPPVVDGGGGATPLSPPVDVASSGGNKSSG
jgi:hypothetical protein